MKNTPFPYLFLFLFPFLGFAQNLDSQIGIILQELSQLAEREETLQKELKNLKLQRIQRDLIAIGLPAEEYIMHSAMALEYAEAFEQARWVAHIITSDIITGSVTRTNDFRPDPKVKTGTAVEEDYFLKYEQDDGSFRYDGFGYDRGHLAPSADFRWSEQALSESYLYSNMSPQLADFNRKAWAELEAALRGYVYNHPETQLYVVSGGVLKEGLPAIEQGVHKVRIPHHFYKVALDLKNKTAVGFIVPHQPIDDALKEFAVSVDEVEEVTGLDFFSNLPDVLEEQLETTFSLENWILDSKQGDVEPIYAPSLPSGHFNTIQAKIHEGKGRKIRVCGTVVSTRYSRSGNLWLNIDKQFPHQLFSVFIRKNDLINFSFQPDKELIHQEVCFNGMVENMNGTPTMSLKQEKQILMKVPRR